MKLIKVLTITLSLVLILGVCPVVQADDGNAEVELKVEVVPPPSPPRGGGESFTRGTGCNLTIDVVDETTLADYNCEDGIILDTYYTSDAGNNVTLGLDIGTRVACGDNVPERLEVRLADQPPPALGVTLVSPVYNLTAYFNGVPEPVTFEPPAGLAINFDMGKVPENTASVYVAYYDEEHGWTRLDAPGGLIAEAGMAVALVGHFTPFAVLAVPRAPLLVSPPLPPPPLARFELRDLDINPNNVFSGETVSISVRATNIGDLGGQYSLSLKIDGLIENSKVIVLAAGQGQEIIFIFTPEKPGSYRVEIGGLEGSFLVKVPPAEPVGYWWLIPLIIGLLLLVWAFLILRKKREQAA